MPVKFQCKIQPCVSTKSFSYVQLFETLWSIACQTSSVHAILQARILEYVAMPSSRGSSQPRDWTQVSHNCRRILYQLSHREAQWLESQVPSTTPGLTPTWHMSQVIRHSTHSVQLPLRTEPVLRRTQLWAHTRVLSFVEIPLSPWHACLLRPSVVSNSFVTTWTVAHHAPLSMGFPRQGYWRGLPFLPPGDLPDPGIVDSLPLHLLGSPLVPGRQR